MTAPSPASRKSSSPPCSLAALMHPGAAHRISTCLAGMLGERLGCGCLQVKRHWYAYLPVALAWGLAYARVCVDPTPRIPLLFNFTGSLPHRVAWMRTARHPLQRGDYVVFSFEGQARSAYPGLHHQPFFKVIRGVPGDRVSVQGRTVSINGEPVGVAKPFAFDRRPLQPIAPTVIPAGHYFVQGLSPDSFDSRYRSSGLIRAEQVLGVAEPLL